uniref:Uncharacterized protein n=1 Tax=Rhizoctonia solani TaxID=456999 RepID=N0A740_9AGAM|nr:hypothetical protein RSOL_m01420 [Rhizoctonia solani]AGK45452.1 hypothetical protein RSOL_m01420 [Rhizoctonia solani]
MSSTSKNRFFIINKFDAAGVFLYLSCDKSKKKQKSRPIVIFSGGNLFLRITLTNIIPFSMGFKVNWRLG